MNVPLRKFMIDLGIWGTAAVLGYLLRLPAENVHLPSLLLYTALSVTVGAVVEKGFRVHRQAWRYVGTQDLRALIGAVGSAVLVLFAAGFLFSNLFLPRSVPLITGLVALFGLCAVRLFLRLQEESIRAGQRNGERSRVLIVGAGSAGLMITREMLRHPEAGLEPIGFLDDEPGKARTRYLGLPVMGTVEDLAGVAAKHDIQEILIAVPSASGAFVRRVVEQARTTGLRYRIIPGVFEILNGSVNISQIRDVQVEDLLRREPVTLNTAEIADYLQGRTVLVTGAGGSIGSEIVRQLAGFGPARIVLFGRGENSIFSIQQELISRWPELRQTALIGDVRDLARLRDVFDRTQPDVVFHAAAHKHVPLMEDSPSEAILNNVIGTQNVVTCCLERGVQRLVNVSTDKAVNPTSVMGASKRMAEMVVAAGAAQTAPGQAFVSVRFGNVLGSRGSVVPTFMRQIRRGGPITVTDPEMVRYFMTIPEAARLVLQAGGLAENGRVYVLNMGDPVRITDLAQDVIRLSGAQDIDIVYSGIRPGEKLYEELLTSAEGTEATTHAEIFSARLQQVTPENISAALSQLQQAAAQQDSEAIRRMLQTLIPENTMKPLHGPTP